MIQGVNERQNDCVVYSGTELLPDSWCTTAGDGPVRTFNPGLLRDGTGWLLAYRIVAPDGLRRIGLCRLDANLRMVAGSAVPWSDWVQFRSDVDYPEVARHWFADPRLYRFGQRLFIYWNSGWHEPRNYQFVVELDPVTLRPVGPARELVLRGERRKLEKNWTFFEAMGTTAVGDGVGGKGNTESGRSETAFAVYSITPHRVLSFSYAGEGDIVFDEISTAEWSIDGYPPNHGGLRGGAPPCRIGDFFWCFCHTVHDGANGYRYLPAIYVFSAKVPFHPLAKPARPFILSNPFGEQRTYERLNTAVGEVIYPCGAACDGARWTISYGINDEYCALTTLAHADVAAAVTPLPEGR